MTVPDSPAPALVSAGRVLIVDDDRRVRELLEAALTTHGFAVLTASDGDEAMKRAHADRPDLVVLDVRLPKRSGLDVCEALRHDTDDPALPIILVSAATDPEQRLHAFARGADDYLAKPFSPRELVARIRRHLARATETRAALQRAVELEREIASARREARRAGDEALRERARFQIASGAASEIMAVSDLDVAAERLLASIQSRTGHRAVALLVPDDRGAALRPWAVRGEAFRRAAHVRLPLGGELARLLAALRRPTSRPRLEAEPALRSELGTLVPGRWTWLAPLAVEGRLEALIVADDRPDGGAPSPEAEDDVAVLCDTVAPGLRQARSARRQCARVLEAWADREPLPGAGARGRNEALALLERTAGELELPPGAAEAIGHAVSLHLVPGSDQALETLAADDPTGLASAVLAAWPCPRPPLPGPRPFEGSSRAALSQALAAYVVARRAGLARGVAVTAALAETSDSAVIRALTVSAARDDRSS